MDEIGQNNNVVGTEEVDAAEILWHPFNSNIMVYSEQKHVRDALEDDRRGHCLAVNGQHVSKAEFKMGQPLSTPDQKADVR
jgi:hypothetical protein